MKPLPNKRYARYTRLCYSPVAVVLLLGLAGCSLSYSLEKSSDSISEGLDSISASFDSFSDSSTSGGDATALLERFFDDVKGLVRSWVLEPGDPGEFEQQLGKLALDYGITDWENEAPLFFSIGSSLRQAGIEDEGLASLPFLLSPVMQRQRQTILAGYHSA